MAVSTRIVSPIHVEGYHFFLGPLGQIKTYLNPSTVYQRVYLVTDGLANLWSSDTKFRLLGE